LSLKPLKIKIMSYSLRTILESGIQENEIIGKRSQVIYKDKNPDEFNDWLEKVNVPVRDNVFALVVSSSVAIPIYPENMHYITDNRGNTFLTVQHKTERQVFNRAELVIFGNYLLSSERNNSLSCEDIAEVHHCDIEDFVEMLVNKN